MRVEIIILGIFFPILFILSSWIIAGSGRLESRLVRISIVMIGIIFIIGVVFALPFVSQPRLASIHLRLFVGIPLAVFGICFRMYPLIYLKKMRRRSGYARPSKWVLTLHGPAYFVASGPHSILRQPQYVGGIVFIVGWFLIWGGLYSLYMLPVLIIFILSWALLEERYILEREFGDQYKEYKKKVGMFFPKSGRK